MNRAEESVRYNYALGRRGLTTEPDAEFDAWLAAHDAEVKADAWDEGFDAGEPIRDDYSPRNPYRTERGDVA